jgi:hypothetical protein
MDTFESFAQLYEWAKTRRPEPLIPSHEIKNLSEIKRKALDDIDRTHYAIEFNKWLTGELKWKPESKNPTNPLTKENFCNFLHFKKQKLERFLKEREAEDRQWLIKAGIIEDTKKMEQVPQMPQVPLSKQKQKGKSGLTQAEFALLCFYEYEISNDGAKWKITTDPVRFANEEGWNSPNSGKGLNDWYSAIQKAEIRIGQADNSDRVLSKIEKRIKNVIPQLTENARLNAQRELELVQNLIKEQSI